MKISDTCPFTNLKVMASTAVCEQRFVLLNVTEVNMKPKQRQGHVHSTTIVYFFKSRHPS
eukprot:1415547-Rhodomonas_salina.1